MTAKAENLNFQIASNEQLHSHGLGGLIKSTLVIPGGGAFISETQKILINSSSSEPFILIVENQYASKRLIKTECNIYAPKSKQLETCATLGYMLQRAPSHNARYTSQNSHFIEWNGEAEGKSMKIGCSGSTANGASKTAGTKLSAKYILAQPKRSIGAKLGKAKTEKRC